MKNKEKLPNEKQPFKHFKLDLTSEEKACIASFDIEKQEEFTGILEDMEQSLEQVRQFIDSLGENNLQSCSMMVDLIFKMARQALDIFQQESAYIILRVSVPNDVFNIPRWHQDGYSYPPFFGQPLKAAIPLKGAGTLFYRPTVEELNKFKQMENNREQLAELLIDSSRKESTPEGHGSLFIVGDQAGTIHSEPNISSQRFFMSVLPGSKKDIQKHKVISQTLGKMLNEGRALEEIKDALNALTM